MQHTSRVYLKSRRNCHRLPPASPVGAAPDSSYSSYSSYSSPIVSRGILLQCKRARIPSSDACLPSRPINGRMYRDKVVYLGQQRCRMCGSFHTLTTSAGTRTPSRNESAIITYRRHNSYSGCPKSHRSVSDLQGAKRRLPVPESSPVGEDAARVEDIEGHARNGTECAEHVAFLAAIGNLLLSVPYAIRQRILGWSRQHEARSKPMPHNAPASAASPHG